MAPLLAPPSGLRCWLPPRHDYRSLQDCNFTGTVGMTGEDRAVAPALRVAFTRAAVAGLLVFPPTEDSPGYEVRCSCGAVFDLPALPWHPEQAAAQLDRFAMRHAGHNRATEEDR